MALDERLENMSVRLIILSACGLARTVEHFLTDQRSRDAIEVAERFADGLATEEEVRATGELRAAVWGKKPGTLAHFEIPAWGVDPANEAAWSGLEAARVVMRAEAVAAETKGLVEHLRRADGRFSFSGCQIGRKPARDLDGDALLGAAAFVIVTRTFIMRAVWWAEVMAEMALGEARAQAARQPILDCILAPRIRLTFSCHARGLAATIYEKRDWPLMPILADALEEGGQTEMAAHCRQPIHAKGCHVLDSIMVDHFRVLDVPVTSWHKELDDALHDLLGD